MHEPNNPFAAPQASLHDLPEVATESLIADPPNKVRIGRGLSWIAGGWRLFMQSPGRWIVMTVIFFIIAALTSIIPLLGLLSLFITLPLSGGMLIGCEALARGEPLRIKHLFAGFAQQGSKLFLLSLCTFGLMIGMFALMFLLLLMLAGASSASVLFQSMMGHPDSVTGGLFAIGGFFLAMLLMIPITLTVYAIVIQALSLVSIHGLDIGQAFSLGWRATIRNIPSLIVYFVGAVLTYIVAMIPGMFMGGLVGFMMGSHGRFSPALYAIAGVAGIVTFVSIAAIFPVMFGSFYRLYRETLTVPPMSEA